jgi:ABC-type transport system involved in multi-copper enzyme maturation permease subunit
MNCLFHRHSQTLATVAWLVRDTFRQSISNGIFAILLAISVISIAVCLSMGVEGPSTLAHGDENPDFLSRRDHEAHDAEKLRTSGVDVLSGELTLAFGTFRVPLARDTTGAVHFVELVLAGGVADTLGLLLTLIWTAGFLPSFLDGRSVCLLLAKPSPRWVLLLGKYLGVLAFVLLQALLFVGGTWTAIGLRTGVWDPTYLLCIPILLLHFSIFFGVSVLLAVFTHNAVVCVFGSIAFWFVAWSMNFGRHLFFTSHDLLAESLRSSYLTSIIDFGYWVLPKPADMGFLLFNALDAKGHFGRSLDFEALGAQGFSLTLSILSSVVFAAGVLLLATRKFEATDY